MSYWQYFLLMKWLKSRGNVRLQISLVFYNKGNTFAIHTPCHSTSRIWRRCLCRLWLLDLCIASNTAGRDRQPTVGKWPTNSRRTIEPLRVRTCNIEIFLVIKSQKSAPKSRHKTGVHICVTEHDSRQLIAPPRRDDMPPPMAVFKIQVLIFQKKQNRVLKAFKKVHLEKLASFLELSPKLWT